MHPKRNITFDIQFSVISPPHMYFSFGICKITFNFASSIPVNLPGFSRLYLNATSEIPSLIAIFLLSICRSIMYSSMTPRLEQMILSASDNANLGIMITSLSFQSYRPIYNNILCVNISSIQYIDFKIFL